MRVMEWIAMGGENKATLAYLSGLLCKYMGKFLQNIVLALKMHACIYSISQSVNKCLFRANCLAGPISNASFSGEWS